MKVLFIGGSGQISTDCVNLAVNLGHEVWVFNRGNNDELLSNKVTFLKGDLHNDQEYQAALDNNFEVICQYCLIDE